MTRAAGFVHVIAGQFITDISRRLNEADAELNTIARSRQIDDDDRATIQAARRRIEKIRRSL